MIDKNKPLLARFLPVLLKPFSLKFGNQPRFCDLIERSQPLTIMLAVGLAVATLQSFSTTKAPANKALANKALANRSLFSKPLSENSNDLVDHSTTRVTVAKPSLVQTASTKAQPDLAPSNPNSLIDQCLNQLVHGPSVEAKVRIEVQQPGSQAFLFDGRFLNLGQASGFSKTGIQLKAAQDDENSRWIWQISRGKTCLIIGSLLGNDRKVEQQPAWLNTNSDQFRQQNDGYGSPISLMHWAKLHFDFQTMIANDQMIEIVGQIRPKVAQSWSDGTQLSAQQLQQRETDPQWLADHVLFPQPHEVRFRFSNQPNTARTLLELELLHFARNSKTKEVAKSSLVLVNWSDWKLAPALSPNDFPLQIDSDQMAEANSPSPIR